MSISNCLLRRQIAICLVLFLVSPFWDTRMAHAQQGSTDQQAEGVSSAQAQSPNATGQIKSGTATAESEQFLRVRRWRIRKRQVTINRLCLSKTPLNNSRVERPSPLAPLPHLMKSPWASRRPDEQVRSLRLQSKSVQVPS